MESLPGAGAEDAVQPLVVFPVPELALSPAGNKMSVQRMTESGKLNYELLEHRLRSHCISNIISSVGVLLILQLVKKSMTENQKNPLFSKSSLHTAMPVTSSEPEQVPAVCIHLGQLSCPAGRGYQ